MKRIALLLTLTLFCVGCSNNQIEQPPHSSVDEQGAMYSNLVDESSQKEVADLLKSRGVTKEQTDTLLSWVDDFNSRVTSGQLPEGFRVMENHGVSYAGLIAAWKESESGEVLPEANCRLTSYLLMKHLIQTNGKKEDQDTFLMFDIEAIDTYEPFYLSKEERRNFISLFSWVPVNETSTVEEHIANIQTAWKDREIQINGEGISLVTVYLHSSFDEVRFVGHTGVLLEGEDGLLFVEKYGPIYPFQATKFSDREELKQYLLGRADLYGDETELEPIVMENDQLI